MTRQIIETADAPAAVGPYSQAVRYGNLVFLSGQIALDPAVGKLVEGDIATQTRCRSWIDCSARCTNCACR